MVDPGQSWEVHIPDSVVLPEGGRFHLAIREYQNTYFDTIIDLGAQRDYLHWPPNEGAVVCYSISREDSSGHPSPFSADVLIWVSAARELSAVLPAEATLSSSPNPFNNEVLFTLELPRAGNVKLDIYDLLGRHVAELLNAPRASGTHTVMWSPRELASGVYVARLAVGGGSRTIKVAYIR